MPRRRRCFLRVRLVLPPADEERAVAACWDAGCLGVQTRSTATDRRRPRLTLEVYFPGRIRPPVLGARLVTALRSHAVRCRRPPHVRRMTDRPWVEEWRRTLRPLRIGRRLLIVPEGCSVPPPRGRSPIRMRFGQAFGTGEHPSTSLALRLMERWLRPRDRVLDLGTGTGILAIAALRLGAARAVAVDRDPAALRVAARNLADNRLRGKVRLREGDASMARGRHDLILVNIGADVIASLLPWLASRLAAGGRVVLSGLLIEDLGPLCEAAARAGLRPAASLRARPWASLVLRRGGDAFPTSIDWSGRLSYTAPHVRGGSPSRAGAPAGGRNRRSQRGWPFQEPTVSG